MNFRHSGAPRPPPKLALAWLLGAGTGDLLDCLRDSEGGVWGLSEPNAQTRLMTRSYARSACAFIAYGVICIALSVPLFRLFLCPCLCSVFAPSDQIDAFIQR